MKRIFFLITCILFCLASFAQDDSSIIKKLSVYGSKQSRDVIFAHFDKTAYSNGENVWFTAYLLITPPHQSSGVLSLALINNRTKTVALTSKFIMVDGIALGNVFLSDSLLSGTYHFILYTETLFNNRVSGTFTQTVTIKNNIEAKAKAGAKDNVIPGGHTAQAPGKITMKFYPEGGYLVNGLTSHIGFEVKRPAGPLQIAAVLYEGRYAIDTIKTDRYGLGTFYLMPRPDSSYRVKVINEVQQDSNYVLPKAISGGAVLKLRSAIANDTLAVALSANKPRSYLLWLHNYQQAWFSIPVKLYAQEQVIKIDLSGIPKGIAELTLLDSLSRPVAERLFFAHFNQQERLLINTDKQTYKTRQKVVLRVNLGAGGATETNGLVSVACVQAGTVQPQFENNIARYFYLTRQLGALPVKNDYMINDAGNKQLLEELLLVKGWRRYSWRDLVAAKTTDTALQKSHLNFTGRVTRYNKRLKKAVDVGLLKDSSMVSFKTDDSGLFNLPDDALWVVADKKVKLFVMAKSADGYNISFTDPYLKVNDSLAKTDIPDTMYNPAPEAEETTTMLNHAIALKEVVIKGVSVNYSKAPVHANACGDYVCVFGILNCPNHRNSLANRPPVLGQKYYNPPLNYEPLKPEDKVTYQGCVPQDVYQSGTKISGIYYPQQFYAEDYTQYNPPEPDYLSTIYWNHLVRITTAHQVQLSFYTSDVQGTFKIIIQGVTDNDVVYGQKEITVSDN